MLGTDGENEDKWVRAPACEEPQSSGRDDTCALRKNDFKWCVIVQGCSGWDVSRELTHLPGEYGLFLTSWVPCSPGRHGRMSSFCWSLTGWSSNLFNCLLTGRSGAIYSPLWASLARPLTRMQLGWERAGHVQHSWPVGPPQAGVLCLILPLSGGATGKQAKVRKPPHIMWRHRGTYLGYNIIHVFWELRGSWGERREVRKEHGRFVH